MSSVIVFGASGMLGYSLVPYLQALGHKVLIQSRTNKSNLCLNPCDREAVLKAFAQYHPDVVVNLIAATNVDQCETEPQLAWRANAQVVGVLAESIITLGEQSEKRPHLVHVSTDQLYDGAGPHSEDEVNLINVYGLSKYTGELLAERVGATVLRTNFYGRSRCIGRISFSDWVVNSLKNQTPITVFDDVKFSAFHLDTLCNTIARCIERRPIGTFNAGCRDSISKAGFTFALAKALNLSTNAVTVGASSDVVLRARRPVDMSLQVSRLENVLNLQFPTLLGEIEYTAREYLNDQV